MKIFLTNKEEKMLLNSTSNYRVFLVCGININQNKMFIYGYSAIQLSKIDEYNAITFNCHAKEMR